jgi:hypothetical protein
MALAIAGCIIENWMEKIRTLRLRLLAPDGWLDG